MIPTTVKVSCEPDMMQVHIRSNLLFRGKVYARDRPKSCFVDVGNSMDFTLPIPLHGNECATKREVRFFFLVNSSYLLFLSSLFFLKQRERETFLVS